MKKLIKKICEKCNIPGPQGEPGENGLSAYEIAIENGFIGTVEEWLESLQGETGPKGDPGTGYLATGINAQMQNNQLLQIPKLESVKFDTILFNNSSITLDAETGVFNVSESGIYKIDWQIVYSINANNAEFSIVIDDYNSVSINSSYYSFGQNVGTVIVNASKSIKIINNSNELIAIPTKDIVPVQANITIIKIG